jgi:hypothetical protein
VARYEIGESLALQGRRRRTQQHTSARPRSQVAGRLSENKPETLGNFAQALGRKPSAPARPLRLCARHCFGSSGQDISPTPKRRTSSIGTSSNVRIRKPGSRSMPSIGRAGSQSVRRRVQHRDDDGASSTRRIRRSQSRISLFASVPFAEIGMNRGRKCAPN